VELIEYPCQAKSNKIKVNQAKKLHSMTRKGKIARLPEVMREHINRRVQAEFGTTRFRAIGSCPQTANRKTKNRLQNLHAREEEHDQVAALLRRI
jgi:hypothetical protein